MAVGVGFEPTEDHSSTVFKSCSGTLKHYTKLRKSLFILHL
jgi:hypothetical protein